MSIPPPKLLDQVRNRIRLKHYNICTVQELLGHKNVQTAMIYTHILNQGGRGVVSPQERSMN